MRLRLARSTALCALATACLASGSAGNAGPEARLTAGELPPFFMPSDRGGYIAQAMGIHAEFDPGEVRISSSAGTIRVRFPGASPAAELKPLELRPAILNMIEGDRANWKTKIATYAGVVYRNLYPGIDLVYRTCGANLKSEFIVAPGADPSVIRAVYRGGEKRFEDANGDLVVRTALGEYREGGLSIYQQSGEKSTLIAGRFQVAESEGGSDIGFALGPYDRDRPLIIDPTISFSTYFGGSQFTAATSMAIDASGNIYVAGWTESPDLTIKNGAQSASGGGVDAFVAKLNSTGSTLLYCTYLGGGGDDRAFGIAVDSAGSAYITGWTTSANFPVTSQVYQSTLRGGRDAFVAKLSAAGDHLLYSTYLGGTGYEAGRAIAVDASGNAYVAGETTSTNLPTAHAIRSSSGGQQDAFIAELNGNGTTLLFSTYLGGSGDDGATAIALDGSGNVYVTGATASGDFPTANALQKTSGGNQDAFVTKLSISNVALIYSTYLGGSNGTMGLPEYGAAIDVDAAGSAYVAGVTSSANFPVFGAFQASLEGTLDAFVAKLNPAGNAIIYSTYLGGTSLDVATSIRVDPARSACVAGYTTSSDFPILSAPQTSAGGGYDAFVSCFTLDGSNLEFSTYLGGSESDSANAIAVDGTSVYVSGQTTSTNFPIQSGLQSVNIGGYGAFVTKLAPDQGTKGVLTNPSPGVILSSSTITFGWTAGTGAAGYWLYVGTVAGQGDLFSANVGSATSQTVNGIPMTGSRIYVRLATLLAGVWQYSDYQYSTPSKAAMLTPLPGSVLSGPMVTFTWAAGAGASAYWLDVGTVQGQGNIAGSNVGTSLSQTVSGIPSTASTIYVRLWSQIAGAWQYNAYTYATPSKAAISSPQPGSTLAGSAVTFTWTASAAATGYWLDVGTTQGQGNIFGTNVGASTVQAVTGIPCNATNIYVRLWSLIWGSWMYTDYNYTAATPTKAVMISPTPNTTFSGSVVTFTWSASGATAYWLDVGTVQLQGNIFGSNVGTNTAQAVSGIPTNGANIYVRLWSLLGGNWQYNDYVYVAATFPKAAMISPSPNTTLAGSAVTFSWSSVGATAYWLDVGTVQGQGNLFGTNVGTITSQTVLGIPSNGANIYVRLWSLIGGSWQYNDYTYTASTKT